MNKNNTYLFYPNYQQGTGIYTSHWLPYTIAALWAYVDQFDEIKNNFEVKDLIFKREPIENIVNRMVDPKVCLFSNYIWNENYNLRVAKEIKSRWPGCLIVFGGPQVDENYENFLNRNSFVDSVVIGEGEISLHSLLNDYLNNEVKPVYNLHKRILLENIPSPYTDSSLLSKIVLDNPDTKWASNMETNRGCPFGCTFCDWGSLTQSKIKKFDLKKVFNEIDWFCKHKIEYMYIADANFGVFYERDKEIVEYISKKKIETGYPHALNMTWYKNSTEKVIELTKILHKVDLARGITLSVQSMHDKTLEAINRKNMEVSQLGTMYQICNDNNIRFYTEFIIGLPYETKQSWRETLCTAVELGCHNSLEIFPLEIIRNSELAKQVDEHKMEIFQFETIEPRQETRIPEKHNYVISTKYMTRQELVDGWMWGWFLTNFHNYGWTQIFQKFSYKNLGIRAIDIYEDFFENCLLKEEIFYKLYEQQRLELESFFWKENYQGVDVFQNDDIVIWAHQMKWHEQRNETQFAINKWAKEYFKDKINSDILTELILLSNSFTVDQNTKEDTVLKFNYNLPEYCNLSTVDLKKETVEYKFSNLMEWNTIDEYADKLYYKHRIGFSRRIIKRCF
tara:strand:- start:102 stop:1967 length:1866 start_codon:yes stop_codon:yes gene_type:complete